MAMTSEATVIMNPSSRGTPSKRLPSPMRICRSARSFMSIARLKITFSGSMPSGLPWYMLLSITAQSRLLAAVMA